MPVTLYRNIKAKINSPEKFFPENVSQGEWYDVIGVDTWNYTDSEKKVRTICKLLIINDKMRISSIAMHNCEIVINDE